MKFFRNIQARLENIYGAKTGLNVLDFVRTTTDFPRLGEMLINQYETTRNLDLALIFDRDVLAACGQSAEGADTAVPKNRAYAVSFEEVSHFVYLSYNHHRGRDITALELEMQSEVDRILLAFHGPTPWDHALQQQLLQELFLNPYDETDGDQNRYETARAVAANFIRLIGDNPYAWTPAEFTQLREFFHNDLGGKIHMSRKP